MSPGSRELSNVQIEMQLSLGAHNFNSIFFQEWILKSAFNVSSHFSFPRCAWLTLSLYALLKSSAIKWLLFILHFWKQTKTYFWIARNQYSKSPIPRMHLSAAAQKLAGSATKVTPYRVMAYHKMRNWVCLPSPLFYGFPWNASSENATLQLHHFWSKQGLIIFAQICKTEVFFLKKKNLATLDNG